MTSTGLRSLLLAGALLPAAGRADAQSAAPPVPSPLALADVIALATDRRAEIEAARARVRAAEARPAIVSALPDPMIAPSLDHKPFGMSGADYSITVEQQFPLSGLRKHRRTAALADVDRLRADTSRSTLDVGLQAASAFLMLLERRRTATLVTEQLAVAREVVTAASARYAGGTAPQSDVLRAELEVARLDALARSLDGAVRGAEAMLNTALGLDATLPVPPLVPVTLEQPPPDWTVVQPALGARPELVAGRAEVARADADIEVMRDMARPMLTIRTGPSSTMLQGRGWMAMVGISLPIWRGKLRAGVAEAEAMRAMADADLRAMTRMLEGDAAAAISQVRSARDRQVALTTDVLPRARLAIDPAVAGYTAGRLPLVSVLEAIQALWDVQADIIAADIELGLAWVRLGRAVGSFEGVLR